MNQDLVTKFVARWSRRGDEKSDTQTFWIDLLTNVFEVQNVADFIFFEDRVQLEHKSFIDASIPATNVMIEQKKLGKDLSKPIKQSDGTFLTPFQQAKRYANELPYSQRPRWIVACNFSEFHVYDMEKPHSEPEIILLKNLPTEFYRLKFLVDSREYNLQRELQISLQAGEIVQKLYAALRKNYLNPDDEKSLQSLNKLCVRLVFCLYAESAGIFGDKNIFRNYLNQFPAKFLRQNLIELFKVLDTPLDKRDKYLEEDLKKFPYVNGNLFAEEIEIPNFNDEIKFFLLEYASRNFDWSGISPTIFGAVFESTLNPVTRRSGGMHYTSIENIHKVIDNLFLNDLHAEFLQIKNSSRNKKQKLLDFQNKIAQLKFFDPACGSGNFLTESFISLRRLENEILKELLQEKILLGDFDNPVKVSINQFFGIEINDFACSVAKTALWIAELQMLQETQNIIHKNLNPLPLKNFANIFEGNALTLDWEKICPNPNFIFGNPPFSGGRRMTEENKIDLMNIAKDFPKAASLDFVSCWFIKAAEYIQNSKIHVGFIATSSICEGEQVLMLWKKLFSDFNIKIIYAHTKFKWQSESKKQAGVHCVIVGFKSDDEPQEKFIFYDDRKEKVNYINAYLSDASNIWISNRSVPLCNVPKIANGNKPLDNAIATFTPEERENFIRREPQSEKYFYRYMGGKEFINNIERWILLLNRIPLHILRKMPLAMKIIKEIREYRENSDSKVTRALADTPTKFHFENMPTDNFLVIPQTSSGRRKYIPIGFLTPDIITNNKLQVMDGGGLYELGILSSSVHNSWVRKVAGRFRDDFTYSISLVYNNFVWCEPTDEQRKKIEQTAQNILNCRKNYPDASLADLYDPTLMPKDLRDAHKKNDLAVMEAYGFDKNFSEEEILAGLMKLYQKIFS